MFVAYCQCVYEKKDTKSLARCEPMVVTCHLLHVNFVQCIVATTDSDCVPMRNLPPQMPMPELT